MDQASPQPLSSGPQGPLAAQDAILRCQAALLSRTGLAKASTALAVELAELFSCHRVSIGLLAGAAQGHLRIAGTSQTVEPDQRHEAAVAIVAAMHEAMDQKLSVAWPPAVSSPPISLAHRQLAGNGQSCSVPMVSAGSIVGAISFERANGTMFWPAQIALFEDIGSFAGPILELKRSAELPWTSRIADSVHRVLAAPGKRRAAWAAGVVVAALLLALPLPWRVSAPARLEGSVQRAVVAAADGFLQQANVRPGDRVVSGQVLAQLSSQDLELERKRRESELRQHEGGYRAAQARNDRTQMVISQSKAAEIQALLTLAETQIDRTRLQAPFDGIVIKGDLSQTLGAPVQRGEVLLVLAPTDSFRLILEVDETDIAAIRPGQKGQLALAAQPDQPLAFTTRRIVPVATAADGRNYFEVEATPDQAQSNLRPGLSGVAKIEVGERSLGWLLFHRAAAWLRLSLWSVAL
jgi:multidrug resistance efflux pump